MRLVRVLRERMAAAAGGVVEDGGVGVVWLASRERMQPSRAMSKRTWSRLRHSRKCARRGLWKDGIPSVGRRVIVRVVEIRVVEIRVVESGDRARVDESVVEEIVADVEAVIVIAAETVAETVQRRRALSRVDATTGRTRYGRGLRRGVELVRRRAMMR
jgi:hypothetical protein